jgi:hypothetical protein
MQLKQCTSSGLSGWIKTKHTPTTESPLHFVAGFCYLKSDFNDKQRQSGESSKPILIKIKVIFISGATFLAVP